MKSSEFWFICLLIGITLFIFIVNPFNSINITIIQNKFLPEEKIEYNNNFKINDLSIKKCDYYYNLLNDKDKKIYTKVANAIKNMDRKVFFNEDYSSNINDNISKVIDYFLYDHPEVFYLDHNYVVTNVKFLGKNYTIINLDYTYSSIYEINRVISIIEEEINSIIANLNDKNSFEKELYIHDYLAKKIDYYYDIDKTTNSRYHHIDSFFLENSSVCDGISKAFQIVLDKCKIESILVTGEMNNISHAWNLVKINNDWYNVDLTSNKFIKEGKEGEKYIPHPYFNVSSHVLEDSHIFDEQSIKDLANSMFENFYIYTDSHIYLKDNFNNKLKEIIDSQRNSKILEFSTDYTSNVPQKIFNVLYEMDFNNYKSSRKNNNMKYHKINNVYVIIKE